MSSNLTLSAIFWLKARGGVNSAQNFPIDAMTNPSSGSAAAKLAAWQAAQADLSALQAELVKAMAVYGKTLDEPPRRLIIALERKREEVASLFDIAIEALDALSTARTGHTNFGKLS